MAARPWRVSRWGIAAVAVCGCLYASTWSTTTALGDGPESVAGIATGGVLHAPGYVPYVWAGWWADRLLPGGADVAANALSYVASLVAVALTYLVCRHVGASPPGAALGAVGLGLAASTWYYAGAAEHNAFTLVVLASAVLLSLRLLESPRDVRLQLTTGFVVGVVATLSIPGAASLLGAGVAACWVRRRYITPAAIACTVAVAASTVALLAAATILRAGQDPELNWGNADNLRGWMDLVSLRDFRHPGSTSDVGGIDMADGGAGEMAMPERLANYLGVVVRDLGLMVVGAAAVGAICLRQRRGIARFLAVLAGANLMLLSLTVGVRIRGFESGLLQGHVLQPVLLAVATVSSLGWSSMIGRLRRRRRGAVGTALIAAVVVASIAGTLASRIATVNHRHPDLGVRYATDILEEVPRDGLLVVWGAERAFPVWRAQVVDGARPDVVVIAGDLLDRPWYRGQVERRIGRVVDVGDAFDNLVALVVTRLDDEDVALDSRAWAVLGAHVRLNQRGLTALAVPGRPRTPPDSVSDVADRLTRLVAHNAVHHAAAQRWPNTEVMGSYVRALVLASNGAAVLGDESLQRQLLEMILELDPQHRGARAVLSDLDAR